MSASVPPQSNPRGTWKLAARLLTQWVMLFGLWMALSGVVVAEFMIIGGLSAAAAIAVSEFLFHGSHEGKFASAPSSVTWYVRTAIKFLIYHPWLIKEIVISNFHVAYLVLHPKMPIDPTLIEFDTTLVSERAQVMLAQSITLTPGTVTVDASDGKFLIHCLSRTTRQGIEDGILQKRVAQVFDEPWVEHVQVTDIESPTQVPL
jgi:multicomponent Na+:H+ antiporter subunit E